MRENVFVAEGARVVGDVELGENVNIWYNAVIRGDLGKITIGKRTNIQDNCTLHVDAGCPMTIGEGVTVGHGAILHGSEIGDNTLIGMGAILLTGSKVGKNCLIGAGALVTQNTEIPDGMMAFGSPAKVIRPLTVEEIEDNQKSCAEYLSLMEEAVRKG